MGIANGLRLRFSSKDDPQTHHQRFDLLWVMSPLFWQQFVCEFEYLIMAQINKDSSCLQCESLADWSRSGHLPITDRDQCCLFFDVIMGTTLTDCSTKELIIK